MTKPSHSISIEEFLMFYTAQPQRHRRLLNTFSMMENIGAQKIHRFQRFGFTSEFVLRHAAEEARHALFFRSQAKKLGPFPDTNLTDELLIAPTASRNYLRKLDLDVLRHVKGHMRFKGKQAHFVAYLFTTLLIELRANTLYPAYEKHLRSIHSPISIQSVIAEEGRHLRDIEALLMETIGDDMGAAMPILRKAEQRIYDDWLNQLSEEMSRDCRLDTLIAHERHCVATILP